MWDFATKPRPGAYMNVTMNDNTGRMHIEASISYNDLIRAFPNRKFEKRRSIWVVPIIRRNAEHLLNNCKGKPGVVIAEDVEDHCRQVIESATITRREVFPAWYEFKTEPFPFQRDALDFAWSSPLVAFFMEMGTGKSKTLIDLACARFKARLINALIVYCPVPLRSNWVAEFGIHGSVPYETFVCDTTVSNFEKKAKAFNDADFGYNKLKVFIVGIESFSQGLSKGKAFGATMQFARSHQAMQAVDESHKIKGHDASRAINVEVLGREAKYKAIMSGSPVSLGPTDLYQQFQFLSPDIIGLGDFYSFQARYCEKGGFQNKQVLGYQNIDELMEIVKPFVFQVKKEDVLTDLPAKMFTKVEVELTKEQKELYAQIKKERCADLSKLLASRNGAITESFIELVCENVLAAYTALQQICAGYVSYWELDDHEDENSKRHRERVRIIEPEKNPKIAYLLEFIEENKGHPLIIWAKFRPEIADIVDALTARYGEDMVCQYHGGLNPAERDEQKSKFLNTDAQFFVSNQQTGGTGLTLNKASRTFYMSNSFILVDRMQSEDRNHRIGQKNSVLYADVVAKGTVDETILQAIRDKKDLAAYVRDCMERSPAELLALLG